MTLVWVSGLKGIYDYDAIQYVNAVEAADGQSLEYEVACAINNFVVGCKADGVWNAIKASCILAGARTLNGALVPLKGAAPTNINFVAGDYNRETGLVGDASTKYLNSNRNNNADPQDNRHMSVWVHTAATAQQFGGDIGFYAGGSSGNNYIGRSSGAKSIGLSSPLFVAFTSALTGFHGVSRSASSGYSYRASSSTSSVGTTSVTPANGNIEVFKGGPSTSLESNARLSFYSIGEALDLALLDARVSTLMTDIGAAIP